MNTALLTSLNLDIGPRDPLHLENILIPTDFSEGSLKALRYGVRLAKQFKASVTLLHVYQIPEFGYETASSGSAEEIYEATQQELRHHLERIGEAVKRCHQICAEIVLRDGTPSEQITTFAGERKVDLIVVSTHGLTGLKRLVHSGSTAESIVRHAPCPVLVVRGVEQDFVE